MKHLAYLLSVFILTSCNSQSKNSDKKETENPQPNIVWIVTEDISPALSFYGDSTAKTPHLDQLSKESLIYDNAFAVVGVCAPTRSSIITGMYPTSIGTMHMRTGQDVMGLGRRTYEKVDRVDIKGDSIIQYSAVIPEYVKCYTEYLRAAGYYCTNNQKTDYQFAAPVTAWDENSNKAHWRNRPKNKPFFSVFNIGTTHESQLWKKGDLPLTIKPKDVKVPPYFPDNEASRNTIARHYSNIELMDAEVGAFIKQLKDDGLYDNTIIFFYSDHGGPLPRQKREIYDSGLKVPFMVKGLAEKGRTDRMISFVDLAPTMLSLAGVEPPKYLEGKAFLGEFDSEKRDYIFGSSDRFDEFTDRIRAVRNNQYLYLRNDFPELPKYKDVEYRKNVPMMPPFLELKAENKLNEVQQIWFQTKTKEELYDCKTDPHNINNLAEDPKYASVLTEMRTTLKSHLKDRADYGLTPEAEMIEQMWPNFEQPVTEPVKVNISDKKVSLKSETKGASIAYYVSGKPDEKLNLESRWQLYAKPISLEKGKTIYTIAQRIGFKESKITSQKIE
ncbi:sulfatase-like hydrolase/transferase [Aureibaculum sp. 2210JD6-5]|uniref:sulfatase-like hydrolase/transferase n=1 Tax=Aureibaculum sp. 2210JD6-5 TaxID=3103957 RepID=UPI002AAE4460|nr:sulfatase-like hydrolase/transferase [Aureibaculum sp. 2210JD6-5]MDY7396798.1 sulfatase-like hydrolase/transferase [Aureibaculum sp. 2210JD6-5]